MALDFHEAAVWTVLKAHQAIHETVLLAPIGHILLVSFVKCARYAIIRTGGHIGDIRIEKNKFPVMVLDTSHYLQFPPCNWLRPLYKSDDKLLSHLCSKVFTISPRDYNPSAPFVLFSEAPAKTESSGMENDWRCVMFDRLLTKSWPVSSPAKLGSFLSYFSPKEYERDILKHGVQRFPAEKFFGIQDSGPSSSPSFKAPWPVPALNSTTNIYRDDDDADGGDEQDELTTTTLPTVAAATPDTGIEKYASHCDHLRVV
ncbi:hypothetical protein BYT27DRAFT_7216170 [Phlegmacium glaucopus]|nr:hypothetical protein BYT27DRAFT_7216170 [Phlegmacium glaucopus]